MFFLKQGLEFTSPLLSSGCVGPLRRQPRVFVRKGPCFCGSNTGLLFRGFQSDFCIWRVAEVARESIFYAKGEGGQAQPEVKGCTPL